MEHKNRICTECGNRTNEKKCEICGRKTEIVNHETIEQTTAFDHIPQEDKQDIFDHIPQDKTVLDKTETSRKFSDKKDYSFQNKDQFIKEYKRIKAKKKQKKQAIEKSTLEKFRGFAIVLVVLIFIGIRVVSYLPIPKESKEPPKEEIVEEVTYDDYMKEMFVDSEVTCRVENDDVGTLMHIVNPTGYYVRGDIQDLDGFSYIYFPYLEPYSETIVRDTIESNTCSMENTQTFLLDFHDSDVSYQLFSKQIVRVGELPSVDIVLNEEVDEEQLANLMQHIYAGLVASGRVDIEEVNIYQWNVDIYNMMYTATMDQSLGIISFSEMNEYPVMEDIVVDY